MAKAYEVTPQNMENLWSKHADRYSKRPKTHDNIFFIAPFNARHEKIAQVLGVGGPGEYVCFDTETDGLNYFGESLPYELAAVKVSGGKIVGRYHAIIDCGRLIPANVCAITNISPDTPQKGAFGLKPVSAKTALDGMRKFVGNLPAIAHNADFDASVMENLALVAGETDGKVGFPIYDSMAMYVTLFTHYRREPLPLSSLNSMFFRLTGKERLENESHGALGDSETLAEALMSLSRFMSDPKWMAETVESADFAARSVNAIAELPEKQRADYFIGKTLESFEMKKEMDRVLGLVQAAAFQKFAGKSDIQPGGKDSFFLKRRPYASPAEEFYGKRVFRGEEQKKHSCDMLVDAGGSWVKAVDDSDETFSVPKMTPAEIAKLDLVKLHSEFLAMNAKYKARKWFVDQVRKGIESQVLRADYGNRFKTPSSDVAFPGIRFTERTALDRVPRTLDKEALEAAVKAGTVKTIDDLKRVKAPERWVPMGAPFSKPGKK